MTNEKSCWDLANLIIGKTNRILLYGAPGKKSIILKEEYVSAWASTHKIRKYNKLPKKYELLINEI